MTAALLLAFPGTVFAATVGPDVAVTPGNEAYSVANTSVAANPVRSGHLATGIISSNFASASSRTCYLGLSSDDGQTWRVVPIAGDGTARPLPTGRTRCWYVTPAYDAGGKLHVVFIFSQGAGFAQDYLISSTDDGATFGTLKVLDPDASPSDPNSAGGDYGPAIATGPNAGVVHVSFLRFKGDFSGASARVTSSVDRGETFNTPIEAISPRPLYSFSSLAVDAGGRLYVGAPETVGTFGDPSARVNFVVASSTNGGNSFAGPVAAGNVPQGCGPNFSCGNRLPNLTLAADGPNQVYAAWNAGDPGALSRVFVGRSTNGGQTWSNQQAPAPAGGDTNDQYAPELDVAPDGRVDLAFWDQATDTAAGNSYLTYSTDAARTFVPPLRLSSAPSNSAIQKFLPAVHVASTNGAAYTVWGDSRQSVPSPIPLFDVFFAKVSFPAPPPPPTYPTPTPSSQFAGCPALTANVIRGSAASERINGTPEADRIFSGTGNDIVDGLAGDDCIDLGPGADRGQGGDGDDLILGGLGADRMAGSSGNDRLLGGGGSDQINGGFGNDRLHGQAGKDRINGSRGRDHINGGSSNDAISGGSSGDRIAGDQGNDRINGNSGNDSIKGNSGKDRVSGGSGRDRISGGSGGDRISARDGHSDRVDCGSGRDRVMADPVDRVARNCERVRRR